MKSLASWDSSPGDCKVHWCHYVISSTRNTATYCSIVALQCCVSIRAVLCLVVQSCLTLCNPMDCSPPDSSVHGILQARILEWVAMPSSRDLPKPGIKHRSPTLQADYLPSEPLEKPMNTGVGSLSLLQGIFLTQELNWDLLLCRRILYQLNYQGSCVSFCIAKWIICTYGYITSLLDFHRPFFRERLVEIIAESGNLGEEIDVY